MTYSALKNKSCPTCGGSGKVCIWKTTARSREVYGDDREVLYSADCPDCNGGLEQKTFEVKSRANIPTAFYHSRYEEFNWQIYLGKDNQPIDLSQQKKYVESFINDFPKWQEQGLGFYIYTQKKGTGKTFLASCICNDIMLKYPVVTKFVNASELIDLSNKKAEGEKNPIDVLCECKLLVIDDLGQKLTGKDWLIDILFKIIDYRYQHKLVTLVTSNIKLKELQLDDRIASRLYKMCQTLSLPEYVIRQKEARDEHLDFYKDLGLIGENKSKEQTNGN